MIYKDLPKSYASRIIAALNELHPEIQATILSEDRMLYQLGFARDVPCTLELRITAEQAETIWHEVNSLESDAYGYSNEQMKDPYFRQQQKEREAYYRKFALLEELMLEIMHQEG